MMHSIINALHEMWLLGQVLDVFHTKYRLDTEFLSGQRGLTFKQQMIKNSTKFMEMTICFRIKMDFFTIIGDYIPLFELLDGGGWENGVLVKKFQERTIDWRIRFQQNGSFSFHLSSILGTL